MLVEFPCYTVDIVTGAIMVDESLKVNTSLIVAESSTTSKFSKVTFIRFSSGVGVSSDAFKYLVIPGRAL